MYMIYRHGNKIFAIYKEQLVSDIETEQPLQISISYIWSVVTELHVYKNKVTLNKLYSI